MQQSGLSLRLLESSSCLFAKYIFLRNLSKRVFYSLFMWIRWTPNMSLTVSEFLLFRVEIWWFFSIRIVGCFISLQSIDCSQGHTWADMILPLNHMSVAMDMTFKGFCQNAVDIQIFLMDILSMVQQSNTSLSVAWLLPLSEYCFTLILLVNGHFFVILRHIV